MRRRGILAIMLAAAPLTGTVASAPVQNAADAALAQLIASDGQRRPAAVAPDRWPSVSEAQGDAEMKAIERRLAELPRTVDRAALPRERQSKYDLYKTALEYRLLEARLKKRAFFISGNIYNDAARPGQQMTDGAPLPDREAARNWLARLRALPAALGEYEAVADARRARGVKAMRGVYGQAARGLRSFATGAPCGGEGDNPLLRAFLRKTASLPASERDAMLVEVKAVLATSVCPAYAGFAARTAALESTGRVDGYWSVPGGIEDYRDVVELSLGERVDPGLIHRTGLAEAARLKSELLAAARKLGFTGDLDALPAWLNANAGNSLPGTAAGREAYRQKAVDLVNAIRPRLSGYFLRVPDAPVEVVAQGGGGGAGGGPSVAGTASAFYTGGRDGTGTIHLGIPSGQTIATWRLPTLMYHEGVPGHHFQQAFARTMVTERIDIPPVFSAFHEGWAVYAEGLADEMGAYADPYARIGWIRSNLERAIRLVVDTGVNFERWSADRAGAYQREMTGEPGSVGRFYNWPGQALGYYWGYVHFKRLRSDAEKAVGKRFDIRKFHEAVLRNGTVPFGIVDAEVERWIRAEQENRR